MLQSSSGLFTEVEEDQGDGDQDQAITRNWKIKHENNGGQLRTTISNFQEHDSAWTWRVRHEGASVCRA